MLRELHITNLAVIEDAAVTLTPGLNVFTGQTGAGKSLIIGAFELLLGLRSGGDMLRGGAEEGRVDGVFEIHSRPVAAAAAALIDQPIGPGEQVLITRKLFASGRSSVSINGQPATAAMVRQLGQLLVDIHGQHDHQFLLKPANQLTILDAYADAEAKRHAFSDTLQQLRQKQRQRAELSASANLRRQQLELYEFQADEIDQADPQPGEFPELQARHRVLGNLQRILRDAGQAYAALHEAEGSIVERLQMMVHLLQDLAELDETLAPLAEQIRESTLALEEGSLEIRRYIDRQELDPAELGEIEQRLNELNRLVQKYGPGAGRAGEYADALQPVLAYRQQIGQEIERLRQADQGEAQMQQEIEALRATLVEVGRELSVLRREAADRLRPLVESQLAELGMGEASFEIQFESIDPDEQEPSPSGLESVEFCVRTNPGQPMRPLRKIASGGEQSRIMLAIKSILAGSDRISVLVFDEIDANIGGRLGSVIGRKLRDLAAGARPDERKGRKKKTAEPAQHQILCITHLPQIAAFADQHLRIAKEVTGRGRAKQTRTTVKPLDEAARVEELAEMMAGQDATETTRKQARELLQTAG